MQIPVSPPPQLVERTDARSGPIVNPAYPGIKYGVIFTTNAPGQSPNSPNDFNPADLLGATLLNPDLVNEDPLFTILGGYFCLRTTVNGTPAVEISQIFGDALDPTKGFHLTPGNHMLGDEWEMEDLSGSARKSYLNERTLGEGGWTLLVTYKPQRRQYPFSGRPMTIYHECPELGALALEISGVSGHTANVQATLQLISGQAAGYHWEWGDGSPVETTTQPSATHDYTQATGDGLTYPVKVTAMGPGGCSSFAEQSILIPGYCPTIQIGTLDLSPLSNDQVRVTISLAVTDGPAAAFTWSWGDGSPDTNTTEPTAEHVYTRSFSTDGNHAVRVTASGPGQCIASTDTIVLIPPPPCPAISGISLTQTAGDDQTATFSAQLSLENGSFDSYTFNWGDGSAPETVSVPEADHAYAVLPGTGANYTVRVTAHGPANCTGQTSAPVRVPGVCPELLSIVLLGQELNTSTFELTVGVQVNGPDADQYTFDWGDGSPVTVTDEANATHEYTRPAGDAGAFVITVSSSGPSTCAGSPISRTVNVPGVCPVLLDLHFEIGPQEDDMRLVHGFVDHGGPRPTSFEWNWGDGSPVFTTPLEEAMFDFTGVYGETKTFEVTVKAIGPDTCESSITKTVDITIACDTRLELTYTQSDRTGLEQPVAFEAQVTGAMPASFVWNYGDGSPTETTATPTANHVYAVPIGEGVSYPVTVSAQGPGGCATSAQTGIFIAGECPRLTSLTLTAAAGNAREVKGVVIPEPAPAPAYSWNWGDGTAAETTALPEATHVYAAHYGATKTYVVQVTTSGITSCAPATIEGTFAVNGLCPSGLTLNIRPETATDYDLPVVFLAEIDQGGKYVTSYAWDFGDGSPKVITTEPRTTHNYVRIKGVDSPYLARVTAMGPADCKLEAEAALTVPAGLICPVLQRIEEVISAEDAQSITLAYAPVLSQGQPALFTWNWGDGSPEETTDEPTIYHRFPKGTADQEYVVSLKTQGPDTCVASGNRRTKVPKSAPVCPEIKALKIVSQSNPDDAHTELKLHLNFSGPAPTSFTWTWVGQATPYVTSTADATVLVPRKSSDQSLTLTVTTAGPDNCAGTASTTAVIPKTFVPVVPLFCRLIPYLLAFAGSLALGGLLIVFAAFGQNEIIEGLAGLVWGTVAVAIAAFVVIYWLANKRFCPPTRCDWFAIAGASALGGLIVSFYLLNCIPWIPVAAVMFVAMAVAWFFWFRDCAKNSKAQVLFLFLTAGVLAALINCFLVAHPALGCC